MIWSITSFDAFVTLTSYSQARLKNVSHKHKIHNIKTTTLLYYKPNISETCFKLSHFKNDLGITSWHCFLSVFAIHRLKIESRILAILQRKHGKITSGNLSHHIQRIQKFERYWTLL